MLMRGLLTIQYVPFSWNSTRTSWDHLSKVNMWGSPYKTQWPFSPTEVVDVIVAVAVAVDMGTAVLVALTVAVEVVAAIIVVVTGASEVDASVEHLQHWSRDETSELV